jgi:TonB-linked SusC/RagA family outer membrane protein
MKKNIQRQLIMLSKRLLYGFIIQLFFCSVLIANDSNAQRKTIENVKVKIALKDKPVSAAFDLIESTTDFRFTYNDNVVDFNQAVTINDGNQSVYKVLEEISKQTQMSFVQVNDNIHVNYSKRKKDQGRITILGEEDINISGTVKDQNGSALPGVTIVVEGSTLGTVTDIDGNYALSVPEESILVYSFIGFEKQRVIVGNQSVINIILVEDARSLQEVVVIGYGAVQRADITGSVAQIASKDIDALPVPNVQQALRGRAPGVRVIQNSGQPGSSVQVQIRGGNSFLGSNQPLYVVDGFPLAGGIDFLNPSDIASIDILKDASATAIYGARGANGVVIITTNKGKEGVQRISLDSYYGVQQVAKKFDLMNESQFAEIANELARNDGRPEVFDLNNLPNINTDWQDQIFQSAPIQSHTLTFDGGNSSTKYSVSANYFGQDGIILGSGLQRGSLRMGLDQEVKKYLSIGTNIVATRQMTDIVNADNGHRGSGILSAAFVSPPTVAPFDEDGNFSNVNRYFFSPNVLQNPLLFAEIFNRSTNSNLLADISLNFKITNDLSFKVIGGAEQAFIENDFYSPSIVRLSSPSGNASTSVIRNISYLNENILTYNKTLGRHKLNLVGGFTFQDFRSKNNRSSGSGFVTDLLLNNNLGAAQLTDPNFSDFSEWTILSWLGRANFFLNDKILFTGSLRADGSSRFGANNKWGYFPSGAVAWRISDEAFMKDISWITNLKLRTSYGVTGSTAVSPFQSLNRLGVQRATFGNNDVIGFVPAAVPNDNLKWETTEQFNFGVDFGIIEERFRLTADYYVKNTRDLLARVTLPGSTGFNSVLVNLGEIRNQGFELGIWGDILVNEFKWDVFGQISFNENKVINIGGSDVFGGGLSLPFGSPINIAREGQPLGMFWGFVEDGLNENGSIKFQDLNNDGVINNQDQTIIGNPYPDFIYSLNNNFRYKNFEMNLFIEGVQGADLFFATGGSVSNSFNTGENQLVGVYNDRWTQENQNINAANPKISASTIFRSSDRFIHDASYLRLRNVKLAYNLPFSKWNVKGISNAQIYVSGQNLITITSYPGLDPEVNTRGGTGDLRIGIDETGYPMAKSYTLGLRIGF